MRTGTGIEADEARLTIRKLRPEDRAPLRSILEETDLFSEAEVAVAVELMDIFVNDSAQRDYDIYSAVDDEEVLGYVCVGPTPMTAGTFDLYWIAVRRSGQHRGIGSRLLVFAEELVALRGGRLLIAETSSQPAYDATRRFYRARGYSETARIKDYYKPDDDLVVYAKALSQQGAQ